MRTLTPEQHHQLDAVIDQIPLDAMPCTYVDARNLDRIRLDGDFTLEALQAIVQCLASFAVQETSTPDTPRREYA